MSDLPDRDARFAEILDTTQAHIRAYVAGMGVPLVEVDDIAQEVYLEIYRNLEKVPKNDPPIRWLKGIARNLCLNYFRRESRRKSSRHMDALADLLDRTPASLDDGVIHDEAVKALRGCMEKLSDKNRKMLVMRYLEGLTSERIAQAYEMTAEAVRITLFRVRGKLKACVTNQIEPEA